MDSFSAGVVTALWLGILTSISPCPLATNIAAISYIGRRVGNPRGVFLSGLLYTVGRALVYIIMAAVIVTALLSVTEVSRWLQKHMNQILGPILILAGMVLTGLVRLPTFGGGVSEKTQHRADSFGVLGAGFLGIVFALSFCPVSAALFFGSLIPVSVRCSSTIVIPLVYGLGTALPVLVFAGLIAFGAGTVGRAYDRLSQIESWARRITGLVFIIVGIYLSLSYIFNML